MTAPSDMLIGPHEKTSVLCNLAAVSPFKIQVIDWATGANHDRANLDVEAGARCFARC